MAKVSPRGLEREDRTALEKELRESLKKMQVGEKGIAFLFDLLRPSEVVMVGRRIRIAKRLLSGDTFDEIREKLHVGLATIQAVHAWLEEGYADYRTLVTPQVEWLLTNKKRGKGTKRAPRPPTYACNLYELCKHYPSYAGILGLLFQDDWK